MRKTIEEGERYKLTYDNSSYEGYIVERKYYEYADDIYHKKTKSFRTEAEARNYIKSHILQAY